MLEALYAALAALPVDERLAWTLRHVEGSTLEEVAVGCGCSLATAKRRIARVSRTLRRGAMPPRPRIDFASLASATVTLDEGRARPSRRTSVTARRHVVRARSRASGARRVADAHRRRTVLASFVVRSSPPGAARRDAAIASAGGPAAIASSYGGRRRLGGIVLADGSRVTFLVAGTQLAQSGTKGRQATLVRGSARFDVVHDIDTPFRVTAGSILVEDVGTVFTVRLGTTAPPAWRSNRAR